MKGNSSVWQFGKREKQVKHEQGDKWDAWICEHKNITYFWKMTCDMHGHMNVWTYISLSMRWHVKCIEHIGLPRWFTKCISMSYEHIGLSYMI